MEEKNKEEEQIIEEILTIKIPVFNRTGTTTIKLMSILFWPLSDILM